MGVDEEGTLECLTALRRELLDPQIAEHRGHIVKTTGDGLLVGCEPSSIGHCEANQAMTFAPRRSSRVARS
jgi:class 3 adenylate cyclase